MLLHLAHPVLDGTEALSVCDVVGYDDSVSSLIVAASDGFESLLARGVPDLQFDGFPIDIDGSNFEVDSDGGHEIISEDVVGESEEQGRLSDSGVSDQQDLEQVVVFGVHICFFFEIINIEKYNSDKYALLTPV